MRWTYSVKAAPLVVALLLLQSCSPSSSFSPDPDSGSAAATKSAPSIEAPDSGEVSEVLALVERGEVAISSSEHIVFGNRVGDPVEIVSINDEFLAINNEWLRLSVRTDSAERKSLYDLQARLFAELRLTMNFWINEHGDNDIELATQRWFAERAEIAANDAAFAAWLE